MRNNRSYQPWLSVLTLTAMAFITASTTASAQRPTRANDRQINQLLTRIEARTDSFRTSFEDSLNATRNNNARRTEARAAITSFEESTNRLTERYRTRSVATQDVQNVLDQASRVDTAAQGVWLNTNAQNDWRLLRTDLSTLATYYNVNWQWNAVSNPVSNPGNTGNYGGTPQRRGNTLNGTWRLDTTRSDNINNVADRALRTLPTNEQQRTRNLLTRRLEAPETLAIQQEGRRFTLASTRAPQLTFDADGRSRSETMGQNRTVQVTTQLTGNQLVISSVGDRGTDYNISFDPFEGGQRMRVTRRIYTDRLSQPVTAVSVYEKTSEIAELNLYTGRDTSWNNNGNNNNNNNNSGGLGRAERGPFYVPNGTAMTAVLNTDLDTRNVRSGERFTMTVRSPRQFEGAVIEGTVVQAERSGRVSGRAELGLDFERIRLRNGESYNFAGYLESVRTPDGEDVRVDNEGSVKEDDSQTERTITRSGIGAALGAIVGAIAGGGKGAAIGAAIGAGAGAGSVFIQGRDDLQLRSGTEVTLRASTPRAQEARR